MLAPAFLTEFNIYVMLRSFCVGLLVGFAQMVTLGVGQMNISVGALGGLVAISAGGMMEVLGLPLDRRGAAGAPHRRAGRADQRAAHGADRHQRLHHHARHRLGLHRHQSRHHGVDPLLSIRRRRWSLSARRGVAAFPVSARGAADRRARCSGVFFARTVPGRQLLAVGGNAQAAELSGISRERIDRARARALRARSPALAAVLAVAQLGSAQPTIGADWLLLSFAAPIIGGAALTGGYVSVLGTMFAVLLIALIENGMVLAKVDPYWVQFLLGALILAAVGLNRWRAVSDGDRPDHAARASSRSARPFPASGRSTASRSTSGPARSMR